MIEVEDLRKAYWKRTAIDGISFRVEKGEILGFLGPNGAGKTTTMRILTGFMPPTSGTARVAGLDVVASPREVKRRIGYLPEHPPLYKEMTVRSYLAFVARIKGVPGNRVAAGIASVLERCGLTEVANRLIGNLSKGYQQRVGIAQAIVHSPEVMILDEPTVGLDPRQILKIRNLIRSFHGEKTVILSTHIIPEVEKLCDRVAIINEGRIVALDSQARLAERLQQSERVSVQFADASGGALRSRLELLDGVQSVIQEDGAANRFLVEARTGSEIGRRIFERALAERWPLVEVSPVRSSLEEVFLQLTGEERGVA
ncbi:MAG TPA: ATP-binding cassette domain-containing protein [Candidatus Polarisedimenticolia bacterium]|jgi:ABC-2 type transport system ATP-binding protein|nr:ATP-binding cassette domain-containing protein [Candidatus Polarisedimenticolia bacterium]